MPQPKLFKLINRFPLVRIYQAYKNEFAAYYLPLLQPLTTVQRCKQAALAYFAPILAILRLCRRFKI